MTRQKQKLYWFFGLDKMIRCLYQTSIKPSYIEIKSFCCCCLLYIFKLPTQLQEGRIGCTWAGGKHTPIVTQNFSEIRCSIPRVGKLAVVDERCKVFRGNASLPAVLVVLAFLVLWYLVLHIVECLMSDNV